MVKKWYKNMCSIRFLLILFVLVFISCDVAYCATVKNVDTMYDLLDIEDELNVSIILDSNADYTIDEETENEIKRILDYFYYDSGFNYLVLRVDEIYASNPMYSYAGDGKVLDRKYFIFEVVANCSYNFGIKDGYYFLNFDSPPTGYLSNAKCFDLVYFESGYPVQLYESTSLYWDIVCSNETDFLLDSVGGYGYEVGSEYEFSVLYRDSAYTFDSALGSDAGDTEDTGNTGGTGGTSGDTGGTGSTGGTGGTSGDTGDTSGTGGTGSTGGIGGDIVDSESGVNGENESLYKQAAEKITSVFPFCVPFDIYKAFKSMHSTAVAPVFETELYFPSIDFTFYFKVDMADYESVAYVLRWGIFLLFIVGLMAGTYKLIKWERG